MEIAVTAPSGNVGRHVVRDDLTGIPSYLLHCERSSGQYLFDALIEAGSEHGIDVDGLREPGPTRRASTP